ncbi:Vitamin B12 transporter BtuB [invertebrate metagenome]|uniref:Vitamin B12 transporter BtuB n=1 Tax=invertebrate metagenome TaxID=1711999 RepID=A0A2H9T7H5_9ZZZZ
MPDHQIIISHRVTDPKAIIWIFLTTISIIVTTGFPLLSQADDTCYLDDVLITASRTAQTVDETLASVTVISREVIEQSQATDIIDLLKTVPGIQISQNGGRGSLSSIFVRGASSSQTLILIDGLRLNNATSGTPEIQYLVPDQIERIEIVRGPRSSLYGADAIGGVIQIFTRQGREKPELAIKTSTGSRDTHEISIHADGKSHDTRYSLGASLYETQGYNSTNDHYPANTGVNLDDNAYRNKSLTANLSHYFDNGVEAGISSSYQEGKVEYDGYTFSKNFTTYPYSAYTLFRTAFVNAYGLFPICDNWDSRIAVGYSDQKSRQRGKNDHPSAPYIPDFYTTQRLSGLWQNNISWSDNQLFTTGIDYYYDEADSSASYNNANTGSIEKSRYNAAVFIQNQSWFDQSNLQLGLRHDKNESYGDNTTGNIAWGVNLPEQLRLITSYGTAYRAPTFNDLYYPGAGNPELKPETAVNREMELRGLHPLGQWSVSIFQNDIKNMIAWTPDYSGIYKPDNVKSARIRGVETVFSAKWDTWNIQASATWLDPYDKKERALLQRRSRQYATLDINHLSGKYTFGTTIRAQGHSYEDADNTLRLAGFTTIGIRASYRINRMLKSIFKITNILNKTYQTAYGYNGEPRGFFISLLWTPDVS